MNALPTPIVDRVLDLDGPYFNSRELFLAALADGFTPYLAVVLVEECEADAEREFAAQAEAEIAAENAWLVAAENAGWEEAEAERRHYGF